jgi:hypothetical protein
MKELSKRRIVCRVSGEKARKPFVGADHRPSSKILNLNAGVFAPDKHLPDVATIVRANGSLNGVVSFDSGKKLPKRARATIPAAHQLITTNIEVRSDLQIRGYSIIRATNLKVAPELREEQDRFRDFFTSLPKDSYEDDANRYRRLSRWLLSPWNSKIDTSRPAESYKQDRYNPTAPGERIFEPLTVSAQKNLLLHALIQFDAAFLPFNMRTSTLPIDVGVHMVSLRPNLGRPAWSSPRGLAHKDGEPMTCVHLIDRYGVNGGESRIADNELTWVHKFTLNDFLDTLVIWDHMVYHHATEVQLADGYNEGRRDALLIDFTQTAVVRK